MMKSLFENAPKCDKTRSKYGYEKGYGEAIVNMRVASEACVIASQKRQSNRATRSNKATEQQSNKHNKATNTTSNKATSNKVA